MGMFEIVIEKPAEVSRSVFHHYVKHTPLQLTSAGFSITISNTPIASTDFSKFFHDYIKHIHRLD
jgi:hypothetical protein